MAGHPRHRNRWPFALCTCVALLLGLRALAATLVVDSAGGTPYATIQSAVDAAMPGQDDVFVRCGTYVENVVMRDDIPVRGQSPHCAIIDGGGQGVTVDLDRLGPGTRLEGFTIRNGNDPFGTGGGVRILGGAPVVTRNIIADNGLPFGPNGAGVHLSGLGSSFQAGAIVTYNIIRGNEGLSGAGVLAYYADGARITANLISGNAGYYGGGVFLRGGSTTVTLTNNTIVGNTAYIGAGIANYDPTHVVANNVIAYNEALILGAGVWFQCTGPTFAHNDVFGNVPDQYQCGVDPTGIDGNISSDPRFVERNDLAFGGFQPRSDSPLVDAGDGAFTPTIDLRGVVQAVDGDADGVERTDIGARENEGLTRLSVDAAGTFSWDRTNRLPERYDVFRGDLDELLAGGAYAQDPALVPGARQFCDLPAPSLADTDLPAPGRGFFYLPVASGAVVGTLGFDSELNERPRTLTCAGP